MRKMVSIFKSLQPRAVSKWTPDSLGPMGGIREVTAGQTQSSLWRGLTMAAHKHTDTNTRWGNFPLLFRVFGKSQHLSGPSERGRLTGLLCPLASALVRFGEGA